MDWFTTTIIIIVSIGTVTLYRKSRQSRQLAYINSYQFHKSIRSKISKKHPHLSNDQTYLVFRALRDYFWMCNKAKRKAVAMPSQVVDDAWHEFILFTKNYNQFCNKGIGRFLHHTPTEVMSSPLFAQEGIKRAWRLACANEHINPQTPLKLPLIFAIDSMLNIENGFTYSPNCRDKNSTGYRDSYCAGHIGCSSGCAGDSGASDHSGGFFDGIFDSSGSDCGGGCGGD